MKKHDKAMIILPHGGASVTVMAKSPSKPTFQAGGGLVESPSYRRLGGAALNPNEGGLKGSPSMNSLFEQLSDTLIGNDHKDQNGMRSPKRTGNQKFYHLTYVEHIEPDNYLRYQVKHR